MSCHRDAVLGVRTTLQQITHLTLGLRFLASSAKATSLSPYRLSACDSSHPEMDRTTDARGEGAVFARVDVRKPEAFRTGWTG